MLLLLLLLLLYITVSIDMLTSGFCDPISCV